MPVYEYFCPTCKERFEKFRHNMSAAGEPAPCPKCNTESKRLMPSSFRPFSVRDAYPRGLPDTGKNLWGEEKKAQEKKEGTYTGPVDTVVPP